MYNLSMYNLPNSRTTMNWDRFISIVGCTPESKKKVKRKKFSSKKKSTLSDIIFKPDKVWVVGV